MSSTTDHWRLSAITHTDRLVGLAMRQLDDSNEARARWVVHRVLLRAMDNMLGPSAARLSTLRLPACSAFIMPTPHETSDGLPGVILDCACGLRYMRNVGELTSIERASAHCP
ncbi:MAG: hypothetical protein ABW199_00010 [Caulobacterales bacterium]